MRPFFTPVKRTHAEAKYACSLPSYSCGQDRGGRLDNPNDLAPLMSGSNRSSSSSSVHTQPGLIRQE